MKFTYNDGGRAQAGFKGTADDCVARSIAIASGIRYDYLYETLANGSANERITKHSGRISGRRSARNRIHTGRKWFKDWMATLGFTWVPTMQIGSGCRVHLREDELPAGRLVVSVSRHYTAVIDGVIHDTSDPQRIIFEGISEEDKESIGGTRCVYGYWKFRD
jgi:hypothetical protein